MHRLKIHGYLKIEKKLHNDTLEFEKKLAACESTVSFLKDREMELQNKCTGLNEKFHQAELQTAIANTKADNFQNKIKELEHQLKEKSK
jgi:chromosome segregation ATPase